MPVTAPGYSLFPRLLSEPEGSENLRKLFFAALLVVLVALTISSIRPAFAYNPPMISPPLRVSSLKTALILSSLDNVYPLAEYGKDMVYYLTHAGYQVTTLTNTNVTINVLLNQLNNYTIVIWRTNTYTWKHIEYWYVGQMANTGVETQYASDFAQGFMNANAGILGVSLSFFAEHFTSGVLGNVKLMMLISTDSDGIAEFALRAGATTVIFTNGAISLDFGQVDDLTNQVLASLSMGESVYTAVYGVVSPFIQNSNNEDPLDSSYTPPFWYQGDGALQI